MRSGLGVPQHRLLLGAILAAALGAAGAWTVPAVHADEHGACTSRSSASTSFTSMSSTTNGTWTLATTTATTTRRSASCSERCLTTTSPIGFGGAHFYFGAGVWYRVYAPGRFVVVAPPVGVVIPVLPPFYTMVWAGGVPYYYANNVYYVQTPQGYMVAAPPPSSVVVEQPPPVEQPAQTPPPPVAEPRAARRRASRSSRTRSVGRARSSRRRIATSVTLGQ